MFSSASACSLDEHDGDTSRWMRATYRFESCTSYLLVDIAQAGLSQSLPLTPTVHSYPSAQRSERRVSYPRYGSTPSLDRTCKRSLSEGFQRRTELLVGTGAAARGLAYFFARICHHLFEDHEAVVRNWVRPSPRPPPGKGRGSCSWAGVANPRR